MRGGTLPHARQWYFSVGFKNRKGGIEIRNPYFKGAVSPKDITHVSHNAGDRRQSPVLVFEGFMDYLSYLALKMGKPYRTAWCSIL